MLGQCRRRCTSINPAVDQRVVFAGMSATSRIAAGKEHVTRRMTRLISLLGKGNNKGGRSCVILSDRPSL